MKCPKCGYLGFEDVDRCRNCGYDFSLTQTAAVPDLSIRPTAQPPEQPLEDLSFVDDAMATNGPAATGPPRTESELPLFVKTIPDDEPLIRRAPTPRPPLAVRRASPEVPRVRSEPLRSASLDLSLEPDQPATPGAPLDPAARARAEGWNDAPPHEAIDPGVAPRVVAVLIDLAILGVIDAIVVYFTMQICGITLAELSLLPKVPLAAFLLVQNGGYLVAFTAGGQTLGKMAAGIRVVPADEEFPIDLGRAFIRTLTWLLLAVPAGLGFLTAVLSRDHRGLHDRFAGTRVVR